MLPIGVRCAMTMFELKNNVASADWYRSAVAVTLFHQHTYHTHTHARARSRSYYTQSNYRNSSIDRHSGTHIQRHHTCTHAGCSYPMGLIYINCLTFKLSVKVVNLLFVVYLKLFFSLSFFFFIFFFFFCFSLLRVYSMLVALAWFISIGRP